LFLLNSIYYNKIFFIYMIFFSKTKQIYTFFILENCFVSLSSLSVLEI
jgi:hypothetical protein